MFLNAAAATLVEQMGNSFATRAGQGSMSISIYDTAWCAMISKTQESQEHWLFPESFKLVLDSQKLTTGGWSAYASDIDGILNTMAALLALLKHWKEDCYLGCPALPTDIDRRISCATTWLNERLQTWEVETCDHVGFEILVPSALDLLRKEGIQFSFPGSECLFALNAQKLANFEAEMLYTTTPTTLVHSLEAFAGIIDFNRVAHHKVDGSMLGSPSATAAYLIYSDTWDEEAEAYLHTVYQQSEISSPGGFPCAFPTSVFELTWVRVNWYVLENMIIHKSSGIVYTTQRRLLDKYVRGGKP